MCRPILGFEPNVHRFLTIFDYILLILHNKNVEGRGKLLGRVGEPETHISVLHLQT